jgi:hypothetical protein
MKRFVKRDNQNLLVFETIKLGNKEVKVNWFLILESSLPDTSFGQTK